MKINKIQISNLYSFKKLSIELDKKMNFIVGPNNSGKTNLYRALNLVKKAFGTRGRKTLSGKDITPHLFNSDKLNASIEIDASLDEEELKLIEKFLKTALKQEEKSINTKPQNYSLLPHQRTQLQDLGIEWDDPSIVDGVFNIIKHLSKLFLDDLQKKLKKIKIIWEFKGRDILNWIESPHILVNTNLEIYENFIYSAEAKPQGSPLSISNFLKNSVPDYVAGKISEIIPEKGLIPSQESVIEKVSENILKDPNEILHYLYKRIGQQKIGVSIVVNSYPKGYEKEYAALCNTLGLNPNNNIKITLWDILRYIFSKSIIEMKEIRVFPESKIPSDFSTDKYSQSYSGTGKDLAIFLHSLKEKDDKRLEEISQSFEEVFNKKISFTTVRDEKLKKDICLREFEKYDVTSQPHNSFEQEEITTVEKCDIKIYIKINNKKLPLEDVGSGIFETLNIISTVIGSQNKVILLDEPGLHLHPSLQKKIVEKLEELTNTNQIIIITHSPYMIDIDTIVNSEGKLYRFYMKDEETVVVDLKKIVVDLLKEDRKSFDISSIKEIKANPSLIRSLFSQKVLLVEGISEYVSIPIFARNLGIPLEDYNIEIVNVGGSHNFERYVEIMKDLNIDYGIVCDGDTAFNLWKNGGEFSVIFDIIDELPEEIKKKIQEFKNELSQIYYKISRRNKKLNSKDKKDLSRRVFQKIYKETNNYLLNMNIFTYPEYDWCDYLERCFKIKKDIKNKPDCAYKLAIEEDASKLQDLKNFLEKFKNRKEKLLGVEKNDV